jgi:hypothetical protein
VPRYLLARPEHRKWGRAYHEVRPTSRSCAFPAVPHHPPINTRYGCCRPSTGRVAACPGRSSAPAADNAVRVALSHASAHPVSMSFNS